MKVAELDSVEMRTLFYICHLLSESSLIDHFAETVKAALKLSFLHEKDQDYVLDTNMMGGCRQEFNASNVYQHKQKNKFNRN